MADIAAPLQFGALPEQIDQTVADIVAFLPNLVVAIIILIVGWLLGRFLGRVIAQILDRAGLDDALRKTIIGKSIEQTGLSIVELFNILVRWFIYLLAILAAISVLQLAVLTVMVAAIASYLPNIAAFILILVVGFILIDWFSDIFRGFGEAQGIAFIGPIVIVVQVFLYFVVTILALQQLNLDLSIIYVFITPIAWGVGLGVGAAIAIIVGFGLKDRAPRMMDELVRGMKK